MVKNKQTNKQITIIKTRKKIEAKYTLNNEVCIYAVGFFGLTLLNLLQISQKQIKRVLTNKMKVRIETSQNKFIRFCLQLNKTTHISHDEFHILNRLPVTERFK